MWGFWPPVVIAMHFFSVVSIQKGGRGLEIPALLVSFPAIYMLFVCEIRNMRKSTISWGFVRTRAYVFLLAFSYRLQLSKSSRVYPKSRFQRLRPCRSA